MIVVTMTQLRRQFHELVRRAEQGEIFVITNRGRECAELRAAKELAIPHPGT